MKFVSTILFAGAFGSALALQLAATAAAQTREKVLYSFTYGMNDMDGADPAADLIDVNNTLYGTTFAGGAYGEGTVFSLDLASGTETVLHMFGNGKDGRAPAGSLIDVNGTLYGTTEWGGKNTACGTNAGCGTVFALDLSSGVETVLYSFCSQQNCPDGTYPSASLISLNAMLVGTTTGGGANRGGTVFALDPGTGAEKVLYSFCGQPNCTDGNTLTPV
jgi:uncharacterized repeat protein (TIGR03803 family)